MNVIHDIFICFFMRVFNVSLLLLQPRNWNMIAMIILSIRLRKNDPEQMWYSQTCIHRSLLQNEHSSCPICSYILTVLTVCQYPFVSECISAIRSLRIKSMKNKASFCNGVKNSLCIPTASFGEITNVSSTYRSQSDSFSSADSTASCLLMLLTMGTTHCHSILLLLESVVPLKVSSPQGTIQNFHGGFSFQDRQFCQCVVVIKPAS
jgi:hypothetical protein